MALGANRDYKTRAVNVQLRLKAHSILTDYHESNGMDRSEASRTAYRQIGEMKPKALREFVEKYGEAKC